ncbi:MAG: hypothetical protein KAJ42_15400 [Gemmatimonadetes bacterium]|nr:hypothetical protein [Gemmatimonadota bacterium]
MGLVDKQELDILLDLIKSQQAEMERLKTPAPDMGQDSYPGSLPMRFPQGEPGGGLPVPEPMGPQAPTPPTPPNVDLLGGRMIQTGGQPPPPSPQGTPTGPAAPPEPGFIESLRDLMNYQGFANQDMGQDSYPGSLPFRAPQPPSGGWPDAPLPPPTPDSRLGAPPADEQGGYSGGRLRFPGLEEEAGELPAAPEKAGDLSRGRASGELEKLYAMQALGEGLGGMEVVTAGDILHRTAKGVGPGKPKGQAAKSYTDFLAKKELGGIGAEDAMALQGLKGTQALEQIEAKNVQGTYGGLTDDQRKSLIGERREWKSNVRIRKLQEASDAANGLLSMIQVEGTISHQMAARMLLAASGEERYSEQDIKGVLESQGLVQSWWDYAVKKVPGKMSDRLKDEYTRVATEMKRIKDIELSKLADEWAEGFEGLSGIPAERIKKDAYNVIEPEESVRVIDTTTGKPGSMTMTQFNTMLQDAAQAGKTPRYRKIGGP